MGTQNAGIVLQVDDTLFTYEGGWVSDNQGRWLNGSSQVGGSSFSYTFTGSSIAFVGTTPGAENKTDFEVTVDGVTSTVQFNASQAGQYLEWYRTPELEDGEHNIVINDLGPASVDYGLITASSIASDDSHVVVDDGNSAIWYTGDWTQDAQIRGLSGNLPAQPFGNTTQNTSEAGNEFKFSFNGVGVVVYSVLRGSALGAFRVNFDVDGKILDRVSISNRVLHDDIQNFPIFTSPSLPPGDHVLTATLVRQEEDLFFSLDYLSISNNSFGLTSSPAPNLDATGSKTRISHSPTQLPPSISEVASTDSGSSSLELGKVIGGALGGVGALILVLGCIWFWLMRRRKWQRDHRPPTPTPFTQTFWSPIAPTTVSHAATFPATRSQVANASSAGSVFTFPGRPLEKGDLSPASRRTRRHAPELQRPVEAYRPDVKMRADLPPAYNR